MSRPPAHPRHARAGGLGDGLIHQARCNISGSTGNLEEMEMRNRDRMFTAAALACGLAMASAATAHADPIADAEQDPAQWGATCQVLAANLNGTMTNDSPVLMGVITSEANYTGLSRADAAEVVAVQVHDHCYAVLDKVVNVAIYWKNGGGNLTGVTPTTSAPQPQLGYAI